MPGTQYKVVCSIHTPRGLFSGRIEELVGSYEEISEAMKIIVRELDGWAYLQLEDGKTKTVFGKEILQQSVISYNIIEV